MNLHGCRWGRKRMVKLSFNGAVVVAITAQPSRPLHSLAPNHSMQKVRDTGVRLFAFT